MRVSATTQDPGIEVGFGPGPGKRDFTEGRVDPVTPTRGQHNLASKRIFLWMPRAVEMAQAGGEALSLGAVRTVAGFMLGGKAGSSRT